LAGTVTGNEIYEVKVIGGPSGELVLHIFDEKGEEQLGWADTGIIL